MSTDDASRRCLPQAILPTGDEAALVDEDLRPALTGQVPHLIRVDQETRDFFVSILADPPANDGRTRLMQAPAPWHQ
ncbi:MAG: hypothetical protein U0Z70_22825 [Thermomicrobiales bacterium]